MSALTRAQREGVYRLYLRAADPQCRTRYLGTYRQFRRASRYDCLLGCVMVPFAGMLVGIEPDGYAHS